MEDALQRPVDIRKEILPYMGLAKAEHIRQMLVDAHQSDQSNQRIGDILTRFETLVVTAMQKTPDRWISPLDGVKDTFETLTRFKVPCHINTGYTPEIARVISEGLQQAGLSFSSCTPPMEGSISRRFPQVSAGPGKTILYVDDTLSGPKAALKWASEEDISLKLYIAGITTPIKEAEAFFEETPQCIGFGSYETLSLTLKSVE